MQIDVCLRVRNTSKLGACAELRKAIVSFVIHVRPFMCLSVRVEQLGPFGLVFVNLIFEDFSKISRENSAFVKI
jgi:hypothetical protein